MPTVSRRLPERPHLDVPKREARELLRQWRAAQPEALERVGARHPKFRSADPAAVAGRPCRLSDAQLVIAREYGFATWTELKQRIDMNPLAHALHPPLFNSVVSCAYLNGRQRDAAMTRALLDRGASPDLRASLRKFLDWRETPGWHEARDVTAAEWARGFPETGWVNAEALRRLEQTQRGRKS